MSMKKAFVVLLSITIFGLVGGSPAWSAGTLKVTTPNGGESWKKGKTYTIKWKKGNGGSRVKIELLKSGKVYKTIKKRTGNDGKFRWKIPSSEKTSKSYRIRITSASKDNVSDSSNKVFSIKKKSTSTSSTGLKVTSPNGGESWSRNSTYTITWNKGTGIDTVQIELWKGSGASGTLTQEIVAETTNDGSYSWAIPGNLSTSGKYEIRIRRVSGSSGSATDSSNSNFSIKKSSTFKLTSSAFKDGGLIPERYTCDGPGPRPPLTISGIPDGTKELVLFLDDLDGTPTATNTTRDWNHWVVFNIPTVSSIKAYSVPRGSTTGKNDTGGHSYEPICPPGEKGDRTKHNYRFTLYAIDSKIVGGPGSSRSEIKSAIDGKVLQQIIFDGHYGTE